MTERGVFTVGRHAANDGAGVDPIVEAALRRRPTSVAPGRARHASLSAGTDGADPGEGDLGWPGEPGDGTGLGWPAGQCRGDVPAGTDAQPAGEQPVRRRGWRRIFGGTGGDGARPSRSAAA